MIEDGSARPADAEPYAALASVYDAVMEHVDYVHWAEYILSLIRTYRPDARDVLELGCGTGSLAVELTTLASYRYMATDASPAMIEVARRKMTIHGARVQCQVADFRDLTLEDQFDIALLLYDGINYLLSETEIRRMLSGARRHLRRGGIFIFDQSTPANSLNNVESFADSGESEEGFFARKSRFDEETNLHHTTFDISLRNGEFHEHHVQRAYAVDEMCALIGPADWDVIATLDGFSREPATGSSERVHWILEAV
ncbi:MAG: class I SAM-dependent methyltransferase [Rhodothermales bacterium]|nr:class I SAM-dependent methyltransferase [Rhodothermales bacterium]